jgi:hypothetical protein
VKILNKQSRTEDKGLSSSFGLGEVLITPRRKNSRCYETLDKAPDTGASKCGNKVSDFTQCGKFLH